MVALVVVCIVIVGLLGLLVIGLLRSHADILRALHSVGAVLGEDGRSRSHDHAGQGTHVAPPVSAALRRDLPDGPLVIGPELPRERTSTSATDVSGTTADEESVAIAVTGTNHLTLLAFLTTGCTSCARVWEAFSEPGLAGLPPSIRPVVVTKGAELESPAEVRARAGRCRAVVVMSTQAWYDYEVPGAPFFALVDGNTSRRIGEGTAGDVSQIVRMAERAMADAGIAAGVVPVTGGIGGIGGNPGEAGRRTGPLAFDGSDREREARNDRELLAVGITPGHASLYPSRRGEVPSQPQPGPQSQSQLQQQSQLHPQSQAQTPSPPPSRVGGGTSQEGG